jgi:hypothetical protein
MTAPVDEPRDEAGEHDEPVGHEAVGQRRQCSLAGGDARHHEEPRQRGFDDAESAGRDGYLTEKLGRRVGQQREGE